MPETLSKRIIPVLAIEKNEVDLIVPHLNVTTALANVYSYSWVFGVTIYYLFYTLIYFWASLVLRNLSRVIFTSFISILSMFLIFNNVLKMPLFAFSVLLIVLISFISKEKLIYAEKELH